MEEETAERESADKNDGDLSVSLVSLVRYRWEDASQSTLCYGEMGCVVGGREGGEVVGMRCVLRSGHWPAGDPELLIMECYR